MHSYRGPYFPFFLPQFNGESPRIVSTRRRTLSRRLKVVDLVEGAMLEVEGANGALKMDLKEEELDVLCNRIARSC